MILGVSRASFLQDRMILQSRVCYCPAAHVISLKIGTFPYHGKINDTREEKKGMFV